MCGDAASGLADLKPSKHIAFGISECLALFECDAGSETVHVLANQVGKFKEDLLTGYDGGVSPCEEGLFRRCCGRSELSIGGLGHSSDEVIGSRIVEIDPRRGLRGDKLVVDEVGCVNDIGDLFVIGGVIECCWAGGCQMAGGGMKSPFGHLL